MALVPKSKGGVVTIGFPSNLVSGQSLVAGENIAKDDACYIKDDGFVYKSVATADGVGQSNAIHFWAMSDYETGQNFSGIEGPVNLGYASAAQTPGAPLFLSLTAGQLNTTRIYVGQLAAAHVWSDGRRIRVHPTVYRAAS